MVSLYFEIKQFTNRWNYTLSLWTKLRFWLNFKMQQPYDLWSNSDYFQDNFRVQWNHTEWQKNSLSIVWWFFLFRFPCHLAKFPDLENIFSWLFSGLWEPCLGFFVVYIQCTISMGHNRRDITLLKPGRMKIEHAERGTLKPKFWKEWMNERNILGSILCAKAENFFQTPWLKH